MHWNRAVFFFFFARLMRICRFCMHYLELRTILLEDLGEPTVTGLVVQSLVPPVNIHLQ